MYVKPKNLIIILNNSVLNRFDVIYVVPFSGHWQVSALSGGDHFDLPALQQTRCGAAGTQTGAGGFLDGFPGGGHQERRHLCAISCTLTSQRCAIQLSLGHVSTGSL